MKTLPISERGSAVHELSAKGIHQDYLHGKGLRLLLIVRQKGIADVQLRRRFNGGFELPAILQIGLNQVVLQQDFQSLGKTFRRVTVYFAYILECV